MPGSGNKFVDFAEWLRRLGRWLVRGKLTVRQKFGAHSVSIPLFLVVLCICVMPQFVLVAVIIALVAGYRMNFEL